MIWRGYIWWGMDLMGTSGVKQNKYTKGATIQYVSSTSLFMTFSALNISLLFYLNLNQLLC